MESEGQKVLHFKQSGNTTQQVLGLSRWLPFAHAFCQDKEWDGEVFTTWILILFHCKWPLHMSFALKPPMEDMDRQVFTNWLFALAFGSCPDREWGYFICLDHMCSLGETDKFLPTDSYISYGAVTTDKQTCRQKYLFSLKQKYLATSAQSRR